MKLGFLAYANSGGLGIQSKRLCELLKPHRVLIIDSRGFSQNKDLHLDWYKDYQTFKTERGFPTDSEIDAFLQGLTHVFMLENPYNFYLPWKARQIGIKTYCQLNYEFSENMEKLYLPKPDLFLSPSYWKLKEMKKILRQVEYLPPPIDPDEFREVREVNFARNGKKRFLHIIGTLAYKDRNGTLDLLEAVKQSKSDFELVIKTQHEIPIEYFLDDPRITYDYENIGSNAELYRDFDAVILPRRYGGLSLVMNEALMAGLPVIMTDIEPNNCILPKKWLVKSEYKSQIVVKSIIDVYSADHTALAEKLNWLMDQNLKREAFNIALDNFSFEVLQERYKAIFS